MNECDCCTDVSLISEKGRKDGTREMDERWRTEK